MIFDIHASSVHNHSFCSEAWIGDGMQKTKILFALRCQLLLIIKYVRLNYDILKYSNIIIHFSIQFIPFHKYVPVTEYPHMQHIVWI